MSWGAAWKKLRSTGASLDHTLETTGQSWTNLFLSCHSIPTINAMYQGRLLLRERLHPATYCCFQSFNPSFKWLINISHVTNPKSNGLFQLKCFCFSWSTTFILYCFEIHLTFIFWDRGTSEIPPGIQSAQLLCCTVCSWFYTSFISAGSSQWGRGENLVLGGDSLSLFYLSVLSSPSISF